MSFEKTIKSLKNYLNYKNMCQINVNGVNITLTEDQLKQIDKQRNKKSIYERINNIYDVFDELNEVCKLPYSNPQNKEEKSQNAYYLLLKIVKVYNEGTILNWTNNNEYKWLNYKYFSYKYFSDGSWSVDSILWASGLCCSAGLCFKDKKLAEDALKKFRNIYDDYWM